MMLSLHVEGHQAILLSSEHVFKCLFHSSLLSQSSFKIQSSLPVLDGGFYNIKGVLGNYSISTWQNAISCASYELKIQVLLSIYVTCSYFILRLMYLFYGNSQLVSQNPIL